MYSLNLTQSTNKKQYVQIKIPYNLKRICKSLISNYLYNKIKNKPNLTCVIIKIQ